MTRMSDHHLRTNLHFSRNLAGTQDRSALARVVHEMRVLVGAGMFVVAVTLGACVIPPSLSVENQDAGVNSPPAILAIRSNDQELPEPGPVLVERGEQAGTMSLTLFDTDLDDVLYVRVFVDYTVTDPKPARSTCTAAVTGTPSRSATCDLTALCQVGDLNIERFMNVAVFDRMLLEDGTSPAYKAMAPGGHTTSKSYLLNCQDSM